MKFKPLHDRVLIEVLDGSEKTAGGIIIPDTAQEKPQEGKVVAVGGGAKTEDGKINSNGRQSWRQSFIWQMVRNWSQNWWQRIQHNERVRHYGYFK